MSQQTIIRRLDEARLALNKIDALKRDIEEGSKTIAENRAHFIYPELDARRASDLANHRQMLRREYLAELRAAFETLDIGLPKGVIEQYTKEANFTEAVEGEPPGA